MKRSDIECTVPQDVLDKLGDRYSDMKYVSRGATSMVFSAHDNILDKRIAIKVLTPSREQDFIRFQKEAKAASQLDHPQLVKILNFDVTGSNHAYLLMDYVDGEDLEAIVRGEGKLSVDRALDIALQICEAMDHAHQKQIAHRDLKASNIIITNFTEPHMHVTVVDFGLARVEVQEGSGRTTPSGSIQGSPRYMSPEQARGESGDIRSDIYALGCILFKMITGDTPFDDTEVIGILRKHVSQAPPRLRDLTDTPIPDQLEAAVAKLLEKEPPKRFQSMHDVYAALDTIRFPEAPVEKIPTSTPPRKLTKAMILWWGAVFTVPVLFGVIFLIPYMAQKFDEPTPDVSPPPVVTNTPPSAAEALRKFKMDSIEFDEPGKKKYLVTKTGDIGVNDEDLQFIGGAMKSKGQGKDKQECEGIDLASCTSVKGDGLKYLRDLDVECINLQGAQLDPIGYQYLGQMPSLREVVLEKSNITDEGAANLANSRGIWNLNLSNCSNLTDEALRSVARLTKITKLDLIGTNVTDAGMKWLRHSPELRRIYLETTQIGDEGLRNLSPCPRLFDLHLVQCRNVTGDGLRFVTKTWPDLAFLEIGGDTKIKPDDLECLRNNKRIHHLNIVGIPISDKELQIIASMPSLSEFYISKGTFSSQALKYLYPLKHLKTVTLIGCKNLTKESIAELRSLMKKSVEDAEVICPIDDSALDGGFKEMYSSESEANERDDFSRVPPVDSSEKTPADHSSMSPDGSSRSPD